MCLGVAAFLGVIVFVIGLLAGLPSIAGASTVTQDFGMFLAEVRRVAFWSFIAALCPLPFILLLGLWPRKGMYGKNALAVVLKERSFDRKERIIKLAREAALAGSLPPEYLNDLLQSEVMQLQSAGETANAIRLVQEFGTGPGADSLIQDLQSTSGKTFDLELMKLVQNVFVLNEQREQELRGAQKHIHDHSEHEHTEDEHVGGGRRHYPCSMAIPQEVWEQGARKAEKPLLDLVKYARANYPSELALALHSAADFYTNVSFGLRFSAQDWHQKSIPLFEEALSLSDGNQNNDRIFLLWDAAFTSFSLRKYSEAADYFRLLIELLETNGPDKESALGVVQENYAMALERSFRSGEARKARKRSRSLLSKVPETDKRLQELVVEV